MSKKRVGDIDNIFGLKENTRPLENEEKEKKVSQSEDQNLKRTTFFLTIDQLVYLDLLSIRIKQRHKTNIKRTHILQAVIDALKEYDREGKILSDASNQEELKNILAEMLKRT